MNYVDEKLKEIVIKIEKQSAIFAINKVSIDTTCMGYLGMSEDQLAKLTPEELCLAEIKLNVYALTIQRHTNTATAIKNWADRCLNLVVAEQYNNFDKYTKYEVRRDMVIINDEYAKRLSEIVNEQTLIIEEMAYLSQSVHHISDAFGRFSRLRRVE